MKTDLHFHSIYSDGEESLKELAENYQKMGFELLSLTDHNCIESSLKFKKILEGSSVKTVAGVEISSQFQGLHIHLLAYNYSPAIKPLIEEIQKTREKETQEKIEKLNDLGLDISYDQLRDLFPKTKYWGDKHLIDLINEDRANQEAIKKYSPGTDLWSLIDNVFNPGKPAHVESEYVNSIEVLKEVKKTGGFVSLAHPGQHLEKKDHEVIKMLAEEGLDGIEAISFQHNWDKIAYYQMLGEDLGLEITAGTDYHGKINIKNGVLSPRQIWDTPDSLGKNLAKILTK